MNREDIQGSELMIGSNIDIREITDLKKGGAWNGTKDDNDKVEPDTVIPEAIKRTKDDNGAGIKQAKNVSAG